MNAKKITALVLAAIMAAGTSTVAFAAADKDTQLEIIPDSPIYTEDDGVLVVDTDGVAPGDTIYIRLDEYEGADASTKDKKRFNVYADWKVGEDSVEDMDIVYKKGDYYTSDKNTTFKFTVDGVSFEISGEGNTTDYALRQSIESELRKQLAKDSDFLKSEIAAQLASYQDSTGWIVNNKFYADADEAAKAAGYVETTGDVYYVAGSQKVFKPGDVANFLVAAGFEQYTTNDLYTDAGTYYGACSTDSSKTPITASNSNVYVNADKTYFVVIDPAGNTDDLAKIDGSKIGLNIKHSKGYKNSNGTELYIDAEAALNEDEDVVVASNGYVNVDGTVMSESDAKEKAEGVVIYAIADDVMGNYDVDFKDGYTYWIKIDTKEDKTTKLLDLAGTLTIGTSRSKAEDGKVYDLDTTMSNRTDPYNVVDEITIEANANGAVKFDKEAEDVVIYFGENEAAWYEFDARGQSALNFEWNMDFNREIADLFPKANIDFISWVAEPSTNRTGDLWITADADTFIYEVTEDGVKEIANAKYDEDEEAWHIRTRKLTAYAISDRELDTSITLDGEDTSSSTGSTTDGGKDNPDTGR